MGSKGRLLHHIGMSGPRAMVAVASLFAVGLSVLAAPAGNATADPSSNPRRADPTPANGPGVQTSDPGAQRTLPDRDDDATLHVLVLGDSYSAGNGAGDYEGPSRCWRSPHNYGNKFAELNDSENHTTTVVDTYACSSAVAKDFWNGRDGRPPMFRWVTHDYDTIMVTIGGNDLNFRQIVKQCLIKVTREAGDCDKKLDSAEEVANGTALSNDIKKVLTGVRKNAAPGTRIVLLGYPYLEANDGHAYKLGRVKVAKRVRALGGKGDDIQSAIVAKLNARTGSEQFAFLTTQDLFAGKLDDIGDRCGLEEDAGHFHELQADAKNPHRWMVQPGINAGLRLFETWYHPNPTGWCEEGQLLVESGEVPSSPFRYEGDPVTIDLTAGSYYKIPLPMSGGVLPLGLRPEGNVPPNVSVSVEERQVVVEALVETPGDYSFTLNVTDDAGKAVLMPVTLRVLPYVPGQCFGWQNVGVSLQITAGDWVAWGNGGGQDPLTNPNLSDYYGTIDYGDGASEPVALNGGPYRHAYNFPGTYHARIAANGKLTSNGRPCHDDVTYPVVVSP